VDAAGIAAGAGRMSPGAVDQFMADGRVRLDQGAAPGAQVVNEGRITAGRGGLAALVGPTARNAGTIEAQGGRVQVAGAAGATVDFDGDGLIALRAAPGALAENTGRILADGGRVRLSVAEAKGVLAGAVNLGGVVEARSVSTEGGGITLGSVQAEGPAVTVTGRVDVTGQRGGSVALLGSAVTVRDGARVDASGAQGGGTVRVGGDVRGAAGIRTARTTTVERGATLAADATANGHGGTVVVWADEAATVAGHLSARGAGEGRGGFAEVSGLLGLAYSGTADLRAPSGQWGTLLFDPVNITVVGSGGTNIIPGPGTPGNVSLNASAVVGALATADVELVADNAITVSAPLTWASAGTLTLTAGQNVTVSQAIRLDGAGGFVVNAGNNASITAPLAMSSTGSVTLNARNDVAISGPTTATGAGSLTVRADSDGNGTGAANMHAGVSLASGTLDVSGASVRIGGGGNLRLFSATGAITIAATAGTVEVASTSALRNTRIETGSGPITVRAAQDVVVRGAGGNGTWSRIASGGTVTVEAGQDVRLQPGTGTNGDNFARIAAGTGMTVTAVRDVIVGTGTGAGNANFNPSGTSLETASGTQTITAGRNLRVEAGGARTEAFVRSGGTQAITAGGAITVTAAGSAASITAAGAQAINATDAITLTGSATGAFEATIGNLGGSQAVTGRTIALTANRGGATITNSGGNQVIAAAQLISLRSGIAGARIANVDGAQTVEAGSLQLIAAPGAAVGIVNNGGAQTVTASTGLIDLLAASNAPATITNLGGAQAVSAATTLTLAAASGTGDAAITNGAGGQAVTAGNDITLAGDAGGAAFVVALGGPQTVTAGGVLRLAGAAGATPLGLSDATPTGAPTPGSASIQSDPGTPPGVAAGTADQRVSALGIIFDGPAGSSAIGLRDWRAINDSPAAAPRYQSVLSGGTQLSVAGSATVFALTPPPAPPTPPASGGTVAEGTLDAGVNALRQIFAPTFPQPVATQLGGGTGGFVPAGLAEEGTRETVEIAGEDPAAVFANATLTASVEGLLPPPVPYFPGFVSPPPTAATLR
jgi:hypothetical protein